MRLSQIFSGNSITPRWQFSAAHTLWRLMFSEKGFIIGEDRNTDKKSVTFFCLDAKTGTTLWERKQFSELWWIGVEGVSGEKLFLHGFQKPDMPEHKTIICVDAATGNELWRNNDCALLTVHSPFVYGYRDLFERRVYYKLNETDGNFIEELNALPSTVDGKIVLEKTDFIFPQSHGGDNENVERFVNEIAQGNKSAIRTVEFIDTGKFTALNIHSVKSLTTHGQENLVNTLYIENTETHKKIFSDILNAETPYPVPDSFFVDHTTLYYIKERKTLVALDLA